MSVLMILTADVPLKEVPPPPELMIVLDIGKQAAEYRNAGIGFAVFETDRVLELQTEKQYFFNVDSYGPGHEENLAAYLREQLEEAGEIELWHVWLDGGFDHRVRRVEIAADELTAEDIRELESLEVWQRDPVTDAATDYCYLLRCSG